MKIRYKTIKMERVEDAPFVGALISSINCNFNCKNCFNQPLKELPTLEKEDIDIIKEIKQNIFNKGIIFAGLEWTLQEKELFSLAEKAHKYDLQTMLYTGNTFKSIKYITENYGKFIDYIKCGSYQEELQTTDHIEYGVLLASSNQHIYKRGIDY